MHVWVWVLAYGCVCVRLRDFGCLRDDWKPVVLVESHLFCYFEVVYDCAAPGLTLPHPTSLIPPSCQMTVRVRTPLKARAFATVTAMRPVVAWPGESAEDAGAAAAAPPAGG